MDLKLWRNSFLSRFILSNYVIVFRTLVSYEQILHYQICSLLMTSLCINAELEGEAGEPFFRRLVLRSVAHVIRLYSSSLITECEGAGWKVVASFEGKFPNRIKQLPLDKHFDINNVKRVTCLAICFFPHLLLSCIVSRISFFSMTFCCVSDCGVSLKTYCIIISTFIGQKCCGAFTVKEILRILQIIVIIFI